MEALQEMTEALPWPVWYRPYAKGVYAITPGLKLLGHDFGNGPADQRLFQLDRQFPRYRANKLAARTALDRYVGFRSLSPPTLAAVCALIVRRLSAEYPELFTAEPGRGHFQFRSRLTGERLAFPVDYSSVESTVAYASAWDALAMQVQEDLCVMSLGNGGNWTSAVHVMAPNYWRPSEILGTDYNAVHGPVPGMDRLKAKAPKLLASIAAGAQYVRFVWGLETDDALNHHPDVVGDLSRAKAWTDTREAERPLFVRIERQTLVGLPEVNSLLFGIRTYIRDVRELPGVDRQAITQALEGMNEAELAYKGLSECAVEFIQHLRA
jgi:hypothetical protein